MSKWCSIMAVIFVVGLCQPALALEDPDANAKRTRAEKKTAVDFAELLNRLEQAEAVVATAREAAAAAKARATDLEQQVEEMRHRLAEAEQKLKLAGTQSTSNRQQEGALQENVAEEGAPTAETLSSLSERMDELKEQIELNTTRIKEHSQTRVETGERFYVRLFGTLLFNTYYNTAGTFDPPTGLYLFSGNNRSLDNGSNFGATIRQTQLGFAFQAPAIGRWKLSGDLQLDFFGGNPPVYNGRAFSPLRLRIARARLESGRLAIVVGQDDPIISPLNPTSLAQVGFPALADSGNLWSWTPQAKAAYRLISRKRERLTIEGGILAPYSGQIIRSFQFETRPDAGERGRMPAFETRLSYRRGKFLGTPSNAYLVFDPQPFQVGIGAHYARQLAVVGTTINSVAVAGDYVIPLGKKMTLSGELFWGRSLSGLGGGIVQGIAINNSSNNSSAIGIRSRGGWAQLQVRPLSKISINFAYGTDDPYNKDLRGTRFELLGATSRAVNRTASANILYRFRSYFIMSVEYRFMQTFFTEASPRINNHINLGFAYLF